MAVIVPQSNTPFQPTQKPRQRFDQPSVADAVAGLADIAVQYGVNQVEHARAMNMQTARVTAAERLGALRDQYEQDPNLEGLATRFEADTQALQQEILETLPEGRQRETFALEYRQMAHPQTRAIGRREYALQRDSALAGLNRSLRIYNREAVAAPDQESRDALLQSAAADIGAAKAAGWISAEDEEALIAGTYGEVIDASALQSLQTDPQEFLDRMEAGEFDDLEPKRAIALKGQADRAVAAAAVLQAKAAEMAAKTDAANLKSEVTDAVKIIESGRAFDRLPELLDRAEGTEHAATLRATVAAVQTEGNFLIIDPADQAQVIAQIEAAPTGDPEDIARLNRLKAIHTKTIESLENDPLSHVSQRGIFNVGPVDLNDRVSIRARIDLAETVTQDIHTQNPQLRYFTNGERDAIRAEIERADPDAQLAIATQLVSGFGDRAGPALQEVGAQDPVFHLAGQLVSQTNDLSAARTMLIGRQLLRDKNGAKPKSAARSGLRAQYTAAFPPADRARLAALFDAADAHYASAGLSVDPDASDDVARAAYAQSLQAVSGGVMHRGTVFGGVQTVRGRPTLLPSTMSPDVVETVLERATPEMWANATASGGPPLIGGRELPSNGDRSARRARIDQLQLMSVGGGRYLVGLPRSDGSMRWLTDPQAADGFYHVDLEALQRNVQGAGQ